MYLPERFDVAMSAQLGTSYEKFVQAHDESPPTSIRINPFKQTSINQTDGIPWCELGFYLPQRPVFTLDPAFHGGAYYVQEASSMFIFHVLKQLNYRREELKILDLCAAPGGKSSLIASYLKGDGLLVSNEIVKNRAYILKYNLTKEGYSNILVTNNEPEAFASMNAYFDIILVDAPCSGEGMFRKEPKAVQEWSIENVELCCKRQKNIIKNILPSLKSGGHLIYSTCTYNNKENLDNIIWAIESFGLESVKVNVPENWGIEVISSGSNTGYQFYPHKLKGEGFFVAVLQKSTVAPNSKPFSFNKNFKTLDKTKKEILNEWVNTTGLEFFSDITGKVHAVPSFLLEEVHRISNFTKIIYCGAAVGEFNKNIFIPDHSLALSLCINKSIPKVDLTLNDALLYLKRDLQTINSTQKSWMLATYNDIGLGWLKNLGNRINNYLPKELRIHMSLG